MEGSSFSDQCAFEKSITTVKPQRIAQRVQGEIRLEERNCRKNEVPADDDLCNRCTEGHKPGVKVKHKILRSATVRAAQRPYSRTTYLGSNIRLEDFFKTSKTTEKLPNRSKSDLKELISKQMNNVSFKDKYLFSVVAYLSQEAARCCFFRIQRQHHQPVKT